MAWHWAQERGENLLARRCVALALAQNVPQALDRPPLFLRRVAPRRAPELCNGRVEFRVLVQRDPAQLVRRDFVALHRAGLDRREQRRGPVHPARQQRLHAAAQVGRHRGVQPEQRLGHRRVVELLARRRPRRGLPAAAPFPAHARSTRHRAVAPGLAERLDQRGALGRGRLVRAGAKQRFVPHLRQSQSQRQANQRGRFRPPFPPPAQRRPQRRRQL